MLASTAFSIILIGRIYLDLRHEFMPEDPSEGGYTMSWRSGRPRILVSTIGVLRSPLHCCLILCDYSIYKANCRVSLQSCLEALIPSRLPAMENENYTVFYFLCSSLTCLRGQVLSYDM